MLTKVYDGTPAQEGESEEVLVFCNLMFTSPVRITFKVTSCSDYADAREPGYHELMEKAVDPPTCHSAPRRRIRPGE